PAILGLRPFHQDVLTLAKEIRSEIRRTGVEVFAARLQDELLGRMDELLVAQAAAQTADVDLESSFLQIQQLLERGQISRAEYDVLASKLFEEGLNKLVEDIHNRKVGSLANVIYYSPEMAPRLARYIESVRAAFEYQGDVTGERFQFHLVSENKSDLMAFLLQLSPAARNAVTVYSVDGTVMTRGMLQKKLRARVYENEKFRESYGVFNFGNPSAAARPQDDDGIVKRTVFSEVPSEYSMVLLPHLSGYFASTSTSDIDAISLREALPDAFDRTVTYGATSGIRIVTELLEVILTAREKIAASA
ncbi:hypothetical protein N9K06_00385, partial [Omnitrophica bacterium]|nr:hypothetical protein [Candidatus Omnitrophota bacterium]